MNFQLKAASLFFLLCGTAINGAQPSKLDTATKIVKFGIATAIFIPLAARALNQLIGKSNLAKIKKDKVGIVKIKGNIVESSPYVESLRSLFEDTQIKAIVLKISSPGGSAGPSQAIFTEILSLKKQFPKYVIAITEDITASGAYYIAAAADYIIATPSAMIGSIGCYMSFPVYYKFLEQYHLKYDYIKNGEHKIAGDPYIETTEAQRKHLQTVGDSVYSQFVKDVAQQRAHANIAADNTVWAEGKIFTGEQALAIGLIDKIGSLTSLIETLKEKAGVTEKIEWICSQNVQNKWLSFLGLPEEYQSTRVTDNVLNSFAVALVHAMKTTLNSHHTIPQ